MISRCLPLSPVRWPWFALAAAFCLPLTTLSTRAAGGVEIKEAPGKLLISVAGEPFSEYRYEGASRPYLFPILGPGGLPMTRSWPMADAPDEEHDHVHHKSFWYAHGDANGHDFWAEGTNAGKTVHRKFIEIKSGSEVGLIRSANDWVAKDGTVVCQDERLLRIHNVSPQRMFDFEITIRASNGDLRLGDTKEGTMALRLAETMRLKGKVGKGHIVNSEGVRDDQTWGKRAAWVDYYGPVRDQVVGVAIFDHPKNPRYPTYWHVRDYGLFAANPFGIHDFEKKPKGTGDLVVKAGESVTFRYRFYFHSGDEVAGQVAKRFQDYIANP